MNAIHGTVELLQLTLSNSNLNGENLLSELERDSNYRNSL